ncbi:MAG: ThuA domain-containing protein [Pseudomonadota bacterium]
MTTQVLVVSKGHDYNHDSFLAMFAAMDDVTATLVEHPAAQTMLRKENVSPYDVIFFYDMCGIPNAGLEHDGSQNTGIPPADYVTAIEDLLESGKGLILVNHATVSWPAWPLWRQISGSSFMLTAGELNGKQVPGSGYRGGHGPLPNATVALQPQQSHPVLEGLSEGFDITDELYLKTSDYETNVLPLLRGDYLFEVKNFTPPPLAPAAEQDSWDHPPGSNLLVWANACRQSPIVVSDVGDGPLAFENPGYQRLLQNAIHWLASAEARTWAREWRAGST